VTKGQTEEKKEGTLKGVKEEEEGGNRVRHELRELWYWPVRELGLEEYFWIHKIHRYSMSSLHVKYFLNKIISQELPFLAWSMIFQGQSFLI